MLGNRWEIRATIRFKLISAIVLVLLLTSLASGAQMLLFSGYMNRYNDMLSGTAGANGMNGFLKPALDDRLRDAVTGKTALADTGYKPLLEEMNAKISAFERGEADPQAAEGIAALKTTMGSLQEQVDKLEKQTAAKASVDEQSATFDYITEITSLVEQDVQTLIRGKLLANETGKESVAKSFRRDTSVYAAVLAAALGCSLFVAWFISGKISRPLKRLSQNLSRLSEGHLSVDKIEAGTKDEIGLLSESFNAMHDGLLAIIASVRETSDQVAASSEHIHDGIRENARAGEEIAKATQSISETLLTHDELVQASAKEFANLFASFRKTVLQMEEINDRADGSLQLAQAGAMHIEAFMAQFGQVASAVDQVSRDTSDLDKLTAEMSGLLLEIREIASETNILSLNASIEAARGAQAGRGFAVIAQRVKQLAGQTASLASSVEDKMKVVRGRVLQIRGRMKESVGQFREGKATAESAVRVFASIREANADVQDNIGSITEDMQHSGNRMERLQAILKEVEERAEHVRAEIEGIASMGEEQVATLQEVAASSDMLIGNIRDMDGAVSHFRD